MKVTQLLKLPTFHYLSTRGYEQFKTWAKFSNLDNSVTICRQKNKGEEFHEKI